MRLFPPPLTPDEKEPLQHLPFESQQLIESYTSLIESVEGEAVFLLDGKWGSGKTTLVEAWVQYIQKKDKENKDTEGEEKYGYKVIYIDAFRHDFSDDPLMMIGQEIIRLDEDRGQGLKKAFISILKLARPVIRVSQELGTPKVMADLSSEALDKILGDRVKETEEKRVKDYQEKLEKLAKDKKIKIIVFIDELDRCRPTYAVEVLEKVKHLFSTDGVIFVLVANTHQLSLNLKKMYGDDIDSQEYLQKFIGLKIQMPDISDYSKQLWMEQFYKNVQKEIEIFQGPAGLDIRNIWYDLLRFLLAPEQSLSYRQLQRLWLEMLLALKGGIQNHFCLMLVYLRSVNNNLYEDIKNKRYKKGSFFNMTGFGRQSFLRRCETESMSQHHIYIILAFIKELDSDEYKELERRLSMSRNSQNEVDHFIKIILTDYYGHLKTLSGLCREIENLKLA